MQNYFSTDLVWDIEQALRRMGEGHYERYQDVYRRVATTANATAGLTFEKLYRQPAMEILSVVLELVGRPAMVSEKLLTRSQQSSARATLDKLLRAIEALPSSPTLYDLATQPVDTYPTLIPLFSELAEAAPVLCLPFLQPDFDAQRTKENLEDLLALVGTTHTCIDLYEKSPSRAIAGDFNRVMVRAKRSGLLVDLVGIRKPAAPGYVSDPNDDRWDVRSCVPPENAVLFKEVHLKINTMAFLMSGLTYGDFFDLPLANPKVLPHFRARVLADKGYWFTPLEQERILAALDQIIDFLQAPEHAGLTFREVYSDPGAPAGVLIHFQRILDVKPEICLPFMEHDFDFAAAAGAIDIFLERAGHVDLKTLYTAPPAPDPKADLAKRILQHQAQATLLRKKNNLICAGPGNCVDFLDEYCSTAPLGNCAP